MRLLRALECLLLFSFVVSSPAAAAAAVLTTAGRELNFSSALAGAGAGWPPKDRCFWMVKGRTTAVFLSLCLCLVSSILVT